MTSDAVSAAPAVSDPPSASERRRAAESCLAVLDTAFFRALCEPARIAVLRRLIEIGRADIGTIAAGLKQDRSVVSRHLKVLADAGIVLCTRKGRTVLCEIDGPAILRRFSALTAAIAPLVPLCCPGRPEE